MQRSISTASRACRACRSPCTAMWTRCRAPRCRGMAARSGSAAPARPASSPCRWTWRAGSTTATRAAARAWVPTPPPSRWNTAPWAPPTGSPGSRRPSATAPPTRCAGPGSATCRWAATRCACAWTAPRGPTRATCANSPGCSSRASSPTPPITANGVAWESASAHPASSRAAWTPCAPRTRRARCPCGRLAAGSTRRRWSRAPATRAPSCCRSCAASAHPMARCNSAWAWLMTRSTSRVSRPSCCTARRAATRTANGSPAP